MKTTATQLQAVRMFNFSRNLYRENIKGVAQNIAPVFHVANAYSSALAQMNHAIDAESEVLKQEASASMIEVMAIITRMDKEGLDTI